MKALIAPNETAYSFDGTVLGVRVVQINAEEFPIAEPLYWVDCGGDIVTEEVYYDTTDSSIKLKPVAPTAVVTNPQVDDYSEI